MSYCGNSAPLRVNKKLIGWIHRIHGSIMKIVAAKVIANTMRIAKTKPGGAE